MGEPKPLSSNYISRPGPQTEATIPSQDPDDINIPSTQAEGLTSNVTPSSPPVTAGTPLTAPYGRAEKIPYLRQPTYVFPDAIISISQAHKDRYPALKDILQRNIDSSPKLCDYSSCISYELRMCGFCAADAIPSVLVFCPFRKLKKIKSLFTQPHIKSQFEPEPPTTTFVLFGLFFWGRTVEMLAFHEIAVVIPEEQDSGEFVADAGARNMPWGLQVLKGEHGEKHTATMGCIIQVGSERFGLTTAHTFHQSPAAATGDHCVGDSDSDTDNEEYDMNLEAEDNDQVSLEAQPLLSTSGFGRTVRLGKCQVHMPPPLEETSTWMKEHANLDWALVELKSMNDGLANYETSNETLPIAEDLPEDCIDVLIITLPLLGVRATLYNIPSYLGGPKGSKAAEVWTVGCFPQKTCESQFCYKL